MKTTINAMFTNEVRSEASDALAKNVKEFLDNGGVKKVLPYKGDPKFPGK